MRQSLKWWKRSWIGMLLVTAVLVSACATLPPLVGNPAAPTVETPAPMPSPAGGAAPVEADSAAATAAATATLAEQLGVAPETITVVSTTRVDWPNGCLGVEQPGMMCTQALVPGFQVLLEANGKQYEVRTDLSGEMAVLAPETAAASPFAEAAQRARERAAEELGLEVGALQIISAEKVNWPDPCLGVPDPAELCAQVMTSGYRVVVEANGQEYVYRTDETGQNIRRERTPPAASEMPPAAQAARDALARELGVPAESINIQRADPVEWPDQCLMVPDPAELCAQMITPGYRVFLEREGEQYIYHTDQTGQNVRRERQPEQSSEGAASQSGDDPVIGLRRDVNGACTDVRIDLQGVRFGACGSEMATGQFLTDTGRLEQLTQMQRLYQSFGVSTPAGKVTFVGQGPINATPAEQRMVAEWAFQVAEEVRLGPGAAQLGLGWRREGGIAGFCDNITVEAGGHAVWTSCHATPAAAPTWQRLTSDQLERFYDWLDRFGQVEAEQRDPATADAMTTSVIFSGHGAAQATEADRVALLQFGNELAQQWAEATQVRLVTTEAVVNIHSGPSDQFEVVGRIEAGQQALVTGVSRDSTWWRVICPDDTVGACWVSGDPTLTRPVTPAGSTGEAPIDETGIIAAVVRQIYTVDDTFGGNSNLPMIYLLAVDDADGSAIPYATPARALPAPVQQGVVAALADLPAQFRWVASAGEVRRNADNVVEGNGAIISIGRVRPQPDGTVQVTSSIYLGPRAAGGQTYVLERVDGAWKITGTTGAIWIS